jgi:hypothetical protein
MPSGPIAPRLVPLLVGVTLRVLPVVPTVLLTVLLLLVAVAPLLVL